MCDGTGVDGSSLGFLTTEQSDMKVAPDPSSSAVLPWDKMETRFICNIMDNDGSPHSTCPRTIMSSLASQRLEPGRLRITSRDASLAYAVGRNCFEYPSDA